MTNRAWTAFGWALMPEDAGPAHVLVCERSGRWALGMRQTLGEPAVRVEETRTLADCAEALARAPASFLVLELTRIGAERLLAWMVRSQREFPLARAAVVAERSLVAYEALVLEAGAVYFTCSPRRLSGLAEMAQRHLTLAPPARGSIAGQVWASLPWGNRD